MYFVAVFLVALCASENVEQQTMLASMCSAVSPRYIKCKKNDAQKEEDHCVRFWEAQLSKSTDLKKRE